MAVLVDVNTLPAVFCESNAQHTDFRPVLDWLLDGNGKLVYGGTKFIDELTRLPRYLKLLQLLSSIHKAKYVAREAVDIRAERNKQIEPAQDFDDPHLVALVAVHKVPVYCSNDARCFRFMNDRRFYDHPSDRPKIYTNIGHRPRAEIMSGDLVVPGLGPYLVLSNASRERLRAALP